LNEEYKRLVHRRDLLIFLDENLAYTTLIKEQRLEEFRERLIDEQVRVYLTTVGELIIESKKSSKVYE